MADSTSETILKTLLTALETAAPAGAEVKRNAVLPTRLPEAGMVILRDGDPGEPEATLSPLAWHYQHQAQAEVMVEDGDGAERDAAFDALKQAVGQAVSADRTLSGLCDWVEAEAPAPQDVRGEQGAAPMKAAVIPIVLHYSTGEDPLG